jgi:hypothetical protein
MALCILDYNDRCDSIGIHSSIHYGQIMGIILRIGGVYKLALDFRSDATSSTISPFFFHIFSRMARAARAHH